MSERFLQRDNMLAELEGREWDVAVIGGGATGLGVAVDAASRGYRTVLVEAVDFGKGTSSRSTKLIHGGLRYLRQGHFAFVKESLEERGILLRNAPHLVKPLSFIVPAYAWWEKGFYGAGVMLYDALAGRRVVGASRGLSRGDALEKIPNLIAGGLRGGVEYFDAQFDDARLCIALWRTLVQQGGVGVNYCRVVEFLRVSGRVGGVIVEDVETDKIFEIQAKVVVNAAGVFSDGIRRMDNPEAESLLQASQGIHLVFDSSFLGGGSGLIVPKTRDNRVLFAIPWQGRVLAGTTDTAVEHVSLEPLPLKEEIDFVLEQLGAYLDHVPKRSDILSVFAGLRPLAKSNGVRNTGSLPRDHVLLSSDSGLVTIAGGKWTTYRKMAEDAVDFAARLGGLPDRKCRTRELPLHGFLLQEAEVELPEGLKGYGADGINLQRCMEEDSEWKERLHDSLPIRKGQILWAVRYEGARTLEDIFARRTRCLLLDAEACLETARIAAEILARELGRDSAWRERQIQKFLALAGRYLPAGLFDQTHGS